MARSKKSAATSNRTTTTARKTPFPKGLAQPALRALAGAGYDHLEQLASVPEASLLCLNGFGPNALVKLRDALAGIGISFAAARTARFVSTNFPDLWCDERVKQGEAFQRFLDLTVQPVGWAYDVWDELLRQLTDKNNRNRSIAAQVLCNLAKSDPSQRMLRDFPALFNVVTDERFVTARHALQAMWKVGCVGKTYQELVVSALEQRFADCVTHKNCTLIRYDIIECLRKLFDAVPDETIRTRAKALIELESDAKYKKKYSTLWPKK
jgi:hypothetical protein